MPDRFQNLWHCQVDLYLHLQVGVGTRTELLPKADHAKRAFSPPTKGRKYGYARVSRGDELTAAGAERIFTDQVSGGKAAGTREGFADLLDHLRDGDILAVSSLDRLGRSLTDLMQTVENLVEDRGVTVRVLTLGDLDTRQPLSRLLLAVLAPVAELERCLIRERTLSALDAARRRNVRLGCPSALTTEQAAAARAMRETGTSAAAVGQAFGVSERTVRR